MSGLHSWRRLYRRSRAEIRAILRVLREEPHAVRAASRVTWTALQLRMKPQDILLYDLDHGPAAQRGDYLTKRSHTALQDLLNPPLHHHLVLDKLDYHVACAERGVAAPPVLAVVNLGPDDGRCAKLAAPGIQTAADLAGFLDRLPDGTRLVLKPLAGSHGRGLFGFTVSPGGAVDTDGRLVEPAEIFRQCSAHQEDGGFLIQKWLEPDPALRPLMPGHTLGTVRVVTVLAGNEVRFPFAFVKIPTGNKIYDAFDHGRSGNLLAQVDVADGSIGMAWGPSRTRWGRLEVYPTHPLTGFPIEGFRIPRWSEVLRAATEGARAFCELKTLGWDIAITPREIFLLEANHHWDPHVPQVLLRRGYLPDMTALVAQVEVERQPTQRSGRRPGIAAR